MKLIKRTIIDEGECSLGLLSKFGFFCLRCRANDRDKVVKLAVWGKGN